MKSYTTLRNLYGTYTLSSDSTNLTLGDQLINDGYRFVLAKMSWPFLEKTQTLSTSAGTQSYKLNADVAKVKTISTINGNIQYIPIEVSSQDDWNRVNRFTSIQSNVNLYYFVKGQTQGGKTIELWPTPSTTLTVYVTYKKLVKDINTADYTTGTITTATNADTIIVGSGTSWNSSNVGDFIRITETTGDKGGDGIWYEIASVESTTSLTLQTAYLGTSIATGSASYTISSLPVIPEDFQVLPVYYAAEQFWMGPGNDKERAGYYRGLFKDGLESMKETYANKDSNPVLYPSVMERPYVNPNNYPFA